ncbi:MAG: hypothetical protein HZC38_12160 [Chloroflexi bacterium]|nr:hypothetical protein [Chloroflexota bacterium]
MPQLIVFVVDNPEKTDEVVDTWMSLGVPGVTIFDSSGIGRATSKRDLLDEMPLMPSLSNLLRSSREAQRRHTKLRVDPTTETRRVS